MTDELERVFAYAYQATGRRRLLEEDIVRLLSHERRWFPPSLARNLVQAARGRGVLRSAGAHAYELSPEARTLSLPLDFRPEAPALEKILEGGALPPASLFRRLVRAVSQSTQVSESELVAAVNRLQQEFGGLLTAEAAALAVARLRDVDVGELGLELERSFQRPPKAQGAK